MEKNAKIYIAGHTGLVGSAITKTLKNKGYTNLLTRDISEMDLTNQAEVKAFFEKEKPEYVILAAAKVGGVVANNIYRGEFIYLNLMIQNNVIHQAYENGVKKLLFLGSTCIYPREAPQPMKEEYLLSGPLEYTNESYAIAKIAGMKLCESYNRQHGTELLARSDVQAIMHSALRRVVRCPLPWAFNAVVHDAKCLTPVHLHR